MLAQYAYNGTGRLVISDYLEPDVKLDLYQGTAGTYAGLDRFGRTIDQRWVNYSSGTVDVSRIKYGYDYAGNRTVRDLDSGHVTGAPTDQDQHYVYDDLHRLVSVEQGTWNGSSISSTSFEQQWTLDQLGNWAEFDQDDDGDSTWDLEQERSHNDANELTEFTTTNWADPVHDAAWNMTTSPQPLVPNSSYTLKYDAWNRLAEIKDGANTVQQNEYDGLGERIVRSVYDSGTLDYRIHYYYNDQWQLLEERKEVSGTEDDDPLSQYVWHLYYIDALAVRYWDGNVDGDYLDTNEGAHDYLQDANYNVTAVVDAGGTVLERYSYTPYGEVTFLEPDFDEVASSAIGNNHLYTGRERDPETGLQLNRHRYYAAHLGRWLTRDPIGYGGADYNLYRYVKEEKRGHSTFWKTRMSPFLPYFLENQNVPFSAWKTRMSPFLPLFCPCGQETLASRNTRSWMRMGEDILVIGGRDEPRIGRLNKRVV